MTRALDLLKKYWAIALVVIGLLAVGYVGYGCGKRSAQGQIAELATKLATSEQTIEIEKGLYAKKVAEVEDLGDLINELGEENIKLFKQTVKAEQEVLALNQLVLKWK